MKPIFTLLVSCFASMLAFAGDVTININNARLYDVLIDGRNVGSDQYNTFTLHNLQPGQHSIELYKQKRNFWESYRKLYSSYFVMKPQSDLYVNVDNNGHLTMDERYAHGNGNYGRDNNYDHDNKYGRRKRERDDDSYEKRNDDRYDGYDKNNRVHDRDDDNRYGGYNGKRPVSNNEFGQLVQQVRSQSFNKLNATKGAVDAYYFTSAQVRELVKTLNFENDKLEVAKYAYRKTVDPENYRLLYDVFSYPFSRDELERYIQQNR